MLVMFGVFAAYFYYDGSVGYRKKNKVFYLHESFKAAGNQFSDMMNANGDLTKNEWEKHAGSQTVNFPSDQSILPKNLETPMPWPDILHDYERMKPLQWNQLWLEYSGEHGYPSSPIEQAYGARKIQEQWVFVYICSALTLIAAWILIRTSRSSVIADETGITTHRGLKVPYSALKTLDLRKWESKGLAYIDYEGTDGSGRLRIDGLTYGGFKKEQGAPAEQLMKTIRDHFSGEIIEYTEITTETAADDSNSETQS